MPIEYSYTGEGELLIKGTGVVTGREISEINEVIYASREKIAWLKYQLCDFTSVEELDVSTEEVRKLAEQDSYAAGINPGMPIIIVCSDDLAESLSQTWQMYSEEVPLQTYLFRSLEEAHAWLAGEARKAEEG